MRSAGAKDASRSPVTPSSTTKPRRLLHFVGSHELGTVAILAVLALSGFVFAKVAGEVGEGEWAGGDRTLLLVFRSASDPADPIGPRWLEEMARDVSALGGTVVLTLLTLGVVGHLLLVRRRRAAAFVAASITGATTLAYVLKDLFARPRPDVVPHLAHVSSASFPSAHSMLSTAVYLTLGALLARYQKSRVLKAYALLWAVLLALLVGVSRVYIGVHWPSDVLGGWAAGAAWAALSWIVARALQRRDTLEPEPRTEAPRTALRST